MELPAYGSTRTESAPAIQEPGRLPPPRRDPVGERAGVRLPGRRGGRLDPDDRLARPEYGEFGEEVIDGVRMECQPAGPSHADPQGRLAAVVTVCLARGYVVSTELLTRTDEKSDFATDVCVRRLGVDPETGGRYLEELAFEVAYSQTLEDLEKVRVPKLLRAGVRRFFAVLVQEGDVLEWSPGKGWVAWAPGDAIRDPVFVQPLEVTAILDAAEVDQLVSKAQLTKKEPHLMGEIKKREARARIKGRAEGRTEGRAEGWTEGRAEGLTEGEARGLARAVLRVFESHGVTLDAENRQWILECRDAELLERLFDRVVEASSASQVLAELEKIDEAP